MFPLQARCGLEGGQRYSSTLPWRSTRREWVVSSTSRPHFNHRKGSVPILQEVGWAPASVWTGGKSCPHRGSIPDRPARSQSLYWLSYPAHNFIPVFRISHQWPIFTFTLILLLWERQVGQDWEPSNRAIPSDIGEHLTENCISQGFILILYFFL